MAATPRNYQIEKVFSRNKKINKHLIINKSGKNQSFFIKFFL